jgi:hypothetical protein
MTRFRPFKATHRYCWRCFQWHRFGLAIEQLAAANNGLPVKT